MFVVDIAFNEAELTPYQLAASQGHIDMVKLLLQEGARVNSMNDFGE